ncbi:hypothetical protein C900_00403 [Fulvivirga imtechensis AK7]|uniref:HTH cro/C1-type domain-containing protein n=1 Tax=Fulvivirga imtechensis AK7 TaxID=1237149 RepID=L8JHY7_9BACT|nr:helix-turn-helix transcriptional regulator [Fulvivirga imtechensis]ELR68435.1 hypothetical protein C900_00403 [Fulvivirga imtechensis AK7]
MKDIIKNQDFSINKYVVENRNELDESLVSLRLMKVVDDFLINNGITHREFAKNLKCSESYISQIMSGSKKFNVAFINKFEKQYNIEIGFVLQDENAKRLREENDEIYITYSSSSTLQIKTGVIDLIEKQGVYSVKNNNMDVCQFKIH